MKTFINFSIAVYVLAGSLLLVIPSGIFPVFYKPTLMASLAFVSAFLIFLPRIIFRKPVDEKKKRALIKFQFLITFILLINGIGGLGLYKLYKIGFEYDKLMHFVSPLLAVLFGSAFISVWFRKNAKIALVITVSLILLGGVLWEILEATSDKFLGTTLLGGGENLIAVDTAKDLFMNVIGTILGAIIFLKKRGLTKKLP